MTPKTKLILVIIISIISIIVSVCIYFGIVRYFQLKYSNINNYIDIYNKLENADKSRVVISFTTSYSLNSIKPMLISILDQTVRVDQIALTIPKNKMININETYSKFLNVFDTNTDYNQFESIIPTLLREGDTETKIICLYDNYIYGIDFIENIVNTSNNNPNSIIICKEGILIKPKFFTKELIDKIDLTQNLQQFFVNFAKENKIDLINCKNHETYSYNI
jgi:hypothetical protein